MTRRRNTAQRPTDASSGTLLTRYPGNPVLTAADWPYPVNSVFNAGAAMLPDGTTLLLCRVEDRRGISHLTAARSADGFNKWVIDPKPTLAPHRDFPEEIWGIEDPRITWVPEMKKFAVAYTSFGRGGPGVSLALTEDFTSFDRLGVVMPPDDKDATLLPRRFGDFGTWVMVHRPAAPIGAHIWLSYSPDLRHWGSHRIMLMARRGAWWDANKIGISPPLIETPDGWLMIYHGVRRTASGSIYRQGLALFDIKDPSRCLLRGDEWILGPREDYETKGDVAGAVFACGYTIAPDGDTLRLYYSGADTCMAVATGSISRMLAWLETNGRPPVDTDI
ncbi:MAG: glycosidase [Planctomycetes bacterium]|nr:glycosidase [Planctomycetota bacterium]